MEVQSVMVTQATSKLGLKFVQQLVSLPYPPSYVFAAYETEENFEELLNIQESSENSSVLLIKIDMNRPEDICEAKSIIKDTVQNRGLDLLINILCPTDAKQSDLSDKLDEYFLAITLAPLTLFKIMQPLLEQAALRNTDSCLQHKSVFLNAIKDNSIVSAPLYETSKVALNTAMTVLADKVRKKGVLVCSTCFNIDGKDKDELKLENSAASILLYIYHFYESRCKIKRGENIIHQL